MFSVMILWIECVCYVHLPPGKREFRLQNVENQVWELGADILCNAEQDF